MKTDTLNLVALKAQNAQLLDSLKHLNVKLNASGPITGMDVLSSVNTFYDTAWTKLIWVVGALLAIVGVVIPLIIQAYQRRKIKADKADLAVTIKNAIGQAKQEFVSNLDSLLTETKEELRLLVADTNEEVVINTNNLVSEEIKRLDKRFKKSNNRNQGRIFQLAAARLYNSKSYNDAYRMTVVSAYYYAKANSKVSALNMIDILNNEDLHSKVSKDEISKCDIKNQDEGGTVKMIEFLKTREDLHPNSQTLFETYSNIIEKVQKEGNE